MASYYVDKTLGDDAGTGAIGDPWEYFPGMPSYTGGVTPQPDDFIYGKRGEIWREQLTVPSSGTSGHPITFGAYGTGDDPIISGAEIITGWTSANGSYQATVTTEPKLVVYNGTILTSNNGAGSGVGLNEWDWNANTLFVNVGEDPDIGILEAGQRNRTITFSGNYVTINGLDLRYANERLVSLWNTSYIIVTNCTLIGAYGHAIYSASNGNNQLTNNSISYAYRGIEFSGGNNVISGNTFSNIPYQSVMPDAYPFPILCGGADDASVVSGNTIGSMGEFGTVDSIHAIYYNGSGGQTNQELYGNIISNVPRGHGIKFIATSGRVSRNRISGANYGGIAVVSNGTINVTVQIDYNIVSGCGKGFVEYEKGSGQMNISLYNNTFYLNNNTNRDIYTDQIRFADNVTSLDIRNNIIYGAPSRYTIYSVSQSNATINYNEHYGPNGNPVYYNGGPRTWTYWQETLGFDTNGLNADPLFVNAAGGDFTLQAGSPCINAGTDVGLEEDYFGNPIIGLPDIGAAEYVAAGPSYPVGNMFLAFP